MLPGKKYSPEDYLRMAWRRRWFIAVPALVIASTTVVVAQFLPNRFRATTSVMIIPQRVPEDFVQSTVTNPLAERLDVISQQILSRTRLERIIQEFNLYERERQRLIMEDVVGQMRSDIKVNINADPRVRNRAANFNISYESPDARTAMRVAERLGSLFVSENAENRQSIADQTNSFLQNQLEDAKRRLTEHETKLRDFRMRNNGVLPEQAQSNLQVLTSSETRLQNNLESQNRDADRLQALERARADISTAPVVRAGTPAATQDPLTSGTAAQQLDAAKAALRNMELRLRPEHPDIGRAKRVVAELEAKAEEEALRQPLSAVSPAPVVIVDREAMARVQRLDADMQELRQRIASSKREETQLRETISSLQDRIRQTPNTQTQLSELTRDYSTLQDSYTSLLKRAEESKLSLSMERRSIGEQFQIIDGARLPERPISPNRPRINMLGLMGGLALGLALAGFLEYRDTSLKSDDEVVSTLSLPVLAVIPLMTSAAERRSIRRYKLTLAASASLVCMVLAAAVMVVLRYRLVDRWLP